MVKAAPTVTVVAGAGAALTATMGSAEAVAAASNEVVNEAPNGAYFGAGSVLLTSKRPAPNWYTS